MNGDGCLHCGLPVPGARRDVDQVGFCCFGCRIAHQLAAPAALVANGDSRPPPASTLLLRLGMGIFLTLNVMVASWLSYSRELFAAEAQRTETGLIGLASYLALFLCTVVVALLGMPMLADSWQSLVAKGASGKRGRGRRIDAQLLIVIGVFSAYLLSVVHTLRGEGSLYFDTASTVLVIVTLGSYLEAGARQRATASANQLLAVLPATVRVRRDGSPDDVFEQADRESIEVGDQVLVGSGETVPVDGTVISGVGRLSEASLTGESWPRHVEPGDRVLAGAQNYEGRLTVEVTRTADETVLAQMERSLASARLSRPPIQRLADRVAAVFVPLVVALAVAVFLLEVWQGDSTEGLLRGLSVLLISCPCALGLAAPLASWYGLRRAAEAGILIDSSVTLERAAAVTTAFFDKTGTLTQPAPALARVVVAEGVDRDWALAAAASLETGSSHPLARALLAHTSRLGIEARPLGAVREVAGLGIEGHLDGRRLRLGGRRWLERCGLEPAALDPVSAGDKSLFLIEDRRVLARFDLRESLRDGVVEVIAELRRRGVACRVLSGDDESATARLAARLGVDAAGGLLPEDKVARVRARRHESAGGRTLAVGDGINDAPVLSAADVGVAIGSASDLASRSGNVRLVSDRLDRVVHLLAIAQHVRRRIRLNLSWSFGFNSLGIALAAAGKLTPAFAALAMVVSSLAVVTLSRGAGKLRRAAEPAPVRMDGEQGAALPPAGDRRAWAGNRR